MPVSYPYCELFSLQETCHNYCEGREFLLDMKTLNAVKENKHCQCVIQNGKCLGKATKLLLLGIHDGNLPFVFFMAQNLSSLTVENMTLTTFPYHISSIRLKSLIIRNCSFTRSTAEKWFRVASHTLEHVEIIRSSFNHPQKDYDGFLDDPLFNEIHSKVAYFRLVDEKGFEMITLKGKHKKLSYLKYKAPINNDKILELLQMAKDSIETLILPECPREIETIVDLKRLKNLRILNGINGATMTTLQTLGNIKVLDVYPIGGEIAKMNFMKLDDDSLLCILSYLSSDDLIALLHTSRRFKHLVTRFLIPKVQIQICDKILMKYPLKENFEFYKCLGERTTSLKLHLNHADQVVQFFVNLTTLEIHIPGDIETLVDFIPSDLQKLTIFMPLSKPSLQKLFKRLSHSLTAIELCGPFNVWDLHELINITHLTLTQFHPHEMESLLGVLQRIKNQLELLEIRSLLHGQMVSFECPMRKLHTLRLHFPCGVNIELKPAEYPFLKELHLVFKISVEELDLSHIWAFKSLRILHINQLSDYRPLLNSLQQLEILEIHDLELYERNYCEMIETGVLNIVQKLPRLRALGFEKWNFSPEFEHKINQSKLKFYRIRNCPSIRADRL